MKPKAELAISLACSFFHREVLGHTPLSSWPTCGPSRWSVYCTPAVAPMTPPPHFSLALSCSSNPGCWASRIYVLNSFIHSFIPSFPSPYLTQHSAAGMLTIFIHVTQILSPGLHALQELKAVPRHLVQMSWFRRLCTTQPWPISRCCSLTLSPHRFSPASRKCPVSSNACNLPLTPPSCQ